MVEDWATFYLFGRVKIVFDRLSSFWVHFVPFGGSHQQKVRLYSNKSAPPLIWVPWLWLTGHWVQKIMRLLWQLGGSRLWLGYFLSVQSSSTGRIGHYVTGWRCSSSHGCWWCPAALGTSRWQCCRFLTGSAALCPAESSAATRRETQSNQYQSSFCIFFKPSWSPLVC